MLLAVPNISEGRDARRVAHIAGPGAIDVHADADHNRAVITYAGANVAEQCLAMASRALAEIDITRHEGAHPRTGAVDVLPFVTPGLTLRPAEIAAARAAQGLAAELGVPVYRYDKVRPLPEVRAAIARGEPPDVPALVSHPTAGVTCVGVRAPLVAFNVNLRTTVERARSIAAAIRARDGGLPGVRALAFVLPSRGLVQVSMNLTRLDETGPAAAFAAVAQHAKDAIVDAEVVGLVPDEVLGQFGSIPLRAPARGVGQTLRG
jgi:glutamate formiminotransferase